MLAIPLKDKYSTVISDLYGNTSYFALLDTDTGDFRVIENKVKGDGTKSADFLNSCGVDSTIYYHMGEGVYKGCKRNNIEVYTTQHNYLTIDEIYLEFLDKKVHKVDETNYKQLLDSGSMESCKCGCENEN